ncbi:MAG: EMC3/TMCO1 family protein [Candidatus Heimdallarchaeota archaeon]|nr:EMC3/TMCO1 family protein [Candidatus Heimdallarchaeota archaeon]MDH5647220.1 EMC3/TMCO1 family protein [Candidatus Heimdallarchaeota archaeon]
MGLFDWYYQLKEAFTNWIIESGLTTPPTSAVFLLIVSLVVSSFSGIVNRLLINMEKVQKESAEMQEHQKRKKKAMETADKKLWIQVKRNEQRFLELQRNTMLSRMLPSVFTIVPMMFVFTTMRTSFQVASNTILNKYCIDGTYAVCGPESSHGAVVVLPIKFHGLLLLGKWFSPYAGNPAISVAGFTFWYFLSSIVVSTLIQRLFGINLTGMQNPSNPMRQ